MYAQSNLNNSSQMTNNSDICDSWKCKYLEIISLTLSVMSLGLSGISLCRVIKVNRELEEGNKKLEKEVELGKEVMREIKKLLDKFIGGGT